MNKLENYRRKHKLSYIELGKKLGVSQPTAWRLCNCAKDNLNFSLLEKISQLTGLSASEIINTFKEQE